MRSFKGFTLVELMITLAVLAIILGIALPNFSELMRANRAQTQANLLLKSLNLARSEAIKRGAAVRVSALSNGNWHLGWRVWSDSNGNGSFDNAELLRLSPAWSGTETLTSLVTEVIFTSGGGLAGMAAGASNNFAFNVGDGYCRYERIITINAVGRATVTPKGCGV